MPAQGVEMTKDGFTDGRARRGLGGEIVDRRGNRAKVYACAAWRNALPTSGSRIF
ncbi:MAG TPA: hypothetical protein VNB49_11310 [Candidatus Dormibacteraeota bacterium]|nr:hypothetical protein [Candidatus Dormibacteraeota bacterium]